MEHSFELQKKHSGSDARAGVIRTAHGDVTTPVFMPVGSQGSVKALTPEDLRSVGARIVLCNAYHIYLRPGVDLISRFGDLHRFMAWDGPILTDSGGYQVFSLAPLRRIDDDGVVFRSHIDGSEHFFSPEKVIEIQEALGADIIMPLDHCPSHVDDPATLAEAMRRTHVWAERSVKARRRGDQALYGIIQGGLSAEMRRASAEFMMSLDFPGYAMGGLSLGEPKEVTFDILEKTLGHLPADRPRYLMGVGSPEDIFEGVARGVDMFDSALPTRTARNGSLFTAHGRHNILNAAFRDADFPVEEYCECYTCRHFTVAYLHHLFKSRELLAYRLASIHNLHFMIELMRDIRGSILNGSFADFKRDFLDGYVTTNEEVRMEQKNKWLRTRRESA